MRSLIAEQLASRIVGEALREAMAGPPEGYEPSYYDDGDPSTDPFEDTFPYLVPDKHPQSPWPRDWLPYAPLIDPNFPSIDSPTGPIRLIQSLADYLREKGYLPPLKRRDDDNSRR